jgi:hypothetical protein
MHRINLIGETNRLVAEGQMNVTVGDKIIG